MKKEQKNSGSSYYFFATVIAVYVIAGLLKPSAVFRALGIFTDILLRIAPVLVLVFFLLFLTDLLISPKKMMKYIGRDSGATGWLVAIVGGIISSGPIYVWYPFLADLRAKGMRPALAATFLYTRAVKVPLLPLMVYYFGVTFTTVLTVYMVLFALVNGYCTEWLMENPPG
ncbi:MAG: hypothetical protein APR53_02380 [Methanoculleus sp. SDB]|nr:MAG: hypothetical protein APR53_02380 [Methanoculleus sp. SDB]